MSFADPIFGLAAAAIAIPLLVVLYFLKLRRQPVRISSTFLWVSAHRDLEANTPFQRLKPSWLFWLQLLALMGLLLALARPLAGLRDSENLTRTILIIDTSASTAAVIGDGNDIEPLTRLDQAKEKAATIVRRAFRSADRPQFMIVQVSGSAQIASPFTSDRTRLIDVIAQMNVIEQPLRLGPALRLAQAHLAAQQDDAAQPTVRTRIIVLSSGRTDEDALPSLDESTVEFIPPDNDPALLNVGITLLSARRSPTDPAQVEILAALVNAGTDEQAVTIRFESTTGETSSRSITIPSAQPPPGPPGDAVVQFETRVTQRSMVRVTLTGTDALSLDDTAAMIVEAPAMRRMLLINPADESAPDEFLFNVLSILPASSLDVIDVARFNQRASASITVDDPRTGTPYDLLVFDRCAPDSVPLQPTLSFGVDQPAAAITSFSLEEVPADRRVLTWERSHPIMMGVNLDNVVLTDPRRLETSDPNVQSLAQGRGGSIIALKEIDRRPAHLAVAFALRKSNWPIQPSFPIFVSNALDVLTTLSADDAGRAVTSRESITLPAAAGVRKVTLNGPSELSVDVDDRGFATIGPFPRVGLYQVAGLGPMVTDLPVSLLSESASDLRPVSDLTLGDRSAPAAALDRALANELWPWLLGVVIALLMIEWLFYAAQSRR